MLRDLVWALTDPVSVPRFVWHLGHAAQAVAYTALLHAWVGLPLLWATVLGASVVGMLAEGLQHGLEGTRTERDWQDRFADWWDYQLAWLIYAGSQGWVSGVVFALVWLVVYLVTLIWRRP